MLKQINIGFSVPTYNEEQNIPIFLDSLLNNFEHSTLNICIVDDQSKDNTINIIKRYCKKYKFISLIERKKIDSRTQVYSAYNAGLEYLYQKKNIDLFCQIDSDNIVDIESVKKSLNYLRLNPHVDVVKLSKYHHDSYINRKLIRKFYSYVYSFICKLFFKSNIKDFSTGIRFYNERSLKFLLKQSNKFKSPIGLLDDLLRLINNDFYITEMPFILTDRKSGNSFISLKESILCLAELFYCIFINKFNKNR